MDIQYDDKMYHQIEKKLSNTIDDSLFTTGKGYEVEQPIPYNDGPSLSRAEYIRQARESCMRQLNNTHMSPRVMDSLLPESIPEDVVMLPEKKKMKVMSFFHQDTTKENTKQELSEFRFLIIRMVCAIVLFLSVFIADQIEIKWGSFTHAAIRECITGNDKLVQLENIFVSFFK